VADFVFAPATKEQEKARIALEGPSGSGKTWTALSIAQGLGQRTAVIDTERGSASKYASDFAFDVCKLYTFDPRDLVKVLAAAAAAGYDTAIVDSFSHFWMGAGGMLEQVDAFAKRSNSGNSFAAWKDARPMERDMIDSLLAFPGHVIVTMRTKSEWVITENDRGRKEPKKIGLKAEQRDGIEYEFDVVGTLDLDHNLVVSKSRISILADKVINRPGTEFGAQVLGWLSDGQKLPTVSDYLQQLAEATNADQVRELWREVAGRNLGGAPCIGPNGEPTTLINLITARGGQLVPGAPATAPAQPQQAAPQRSGKAQRSKGNPPEDDPWATAAPATTTPPTPPAEPAAAPEQPAAPQVPAEQAPQSPKANSALVEAVNVDLGKHGFSGDARIAQLAEMVKRPISSSNDLTVDEARAVLAELARQAEAAARAPEAEAAAGPPEGWTAEDAEQLCADFIVKIEGARSERELVEIAGQIGAAVQAKKLTPEHRDVLLDQHAKAQRVGRGRRQPVGASS
jgi:hypothetical protein